MKSAGLLIAGLLVGWLLYWAPYRHTPEPLPTVYYPTGQVELIWVDLHCKSYYDFFQAGTFTFKRECAVEGTRRKKLIAPFEVQRKQPHLASMTERDRELWEGIIGARLDSPPPTLQDFYNLCADPILDYAILPNEFPGYEATNGHVFIYDCRKIRNAILKENGK
jgi:hypothetical protein